MPRFETYVPVNYGVGKYRKQTCVAVISIITIMLVFCFFALTLKCHCSEIPKMPDKKDDNIEDRSGTVVADKFEREIDMKERSNIRKLEKNEVKLSSFVQEFEKETLTYWACKLEKFVKTRAADVIYDNTKTQNVILIVGPTGIGKSNNAYYAAFRLKEEVGYTILPVRKLGDITTYHIPGTKQIFIIDDFIGKYAVDKTDAELWVQNGPLLKMLFSKKDHQTKIILTSRTYIWQPEWYKCLNIPYCTSDLLSEDLKLLNKERWDICKSYICIDVARTLKKEGIMMYSSFPSVCAMYSSSKEIYLKHCLKVLYLIIEDELNNFKIKSQETFLALAILAIIQIIPKKSTTNEIHEYDELMQDLLLEFSFVQNQSKNRLQSTLTALKGDYVKELRGCFVFIDEIMQKIVLCCIAKTFRKTTVKYCKTDVILNQMRVYCINEEQDVFDIKVTRENTNAYFRRLVIELNNGLYKDVFESAQNVLPKFRVKFLEYIKQNITVNELTKSQEGTTALHVVSALGYHEYVSFFKHYTRIINEKDAAGNIPLHLACKNGHLKIVKDLIENKSSVDISNNDELKPFFHACENGFVDVANYMLHNSAKWIKVNEKYRTKNNRCVLHVVCASGHSHLAALLLKNKAGVNVEDADGCTPLHLACYKGSSEIVSALLGCDAYVNAVDSSGKTSVYIACSENHHRVLQLLLERKAKVNQKTDSGMTPLRVCCKKENSAMVKMLLQNGARVNNKKPSVVPLHEACKAGNDSIIEILIHAKASVNHRTKEGETPLHEACKNGHYNVVKILLDNKAVVDEKDNHGWTALFFSSMYGFHKIVDVLLQKGANPNISDKHTINPLILAREGKHTKVIDLLLQSRTNVKK
ncbi:uncharacterized protein LOC127716078 [Mytilus californianus]|uniref:uncharacterized protein LOC127716078 n=1 Tax=Mytilus californianus TaxID=6549 RepID=UPI0022484FD3|nr:uncharacterized protein LOC127716078 [Mytilus californianus]